MIENRFRAQVLSGRRLGCRLPEQEVEFRETGFDAVAGKAGFDVREVRAGITGMDVDSFAQEFFDFGNERV